MAGTSDILKVELLPQTRQLGSIVSSCNTVMQSLPKIAISNNTPSKDQGDVTSFHSEEKKHPKGPNLIVLWVCSHKIYCFIGS